MVQNTLKTLARRIYLSFKNEIDTSSLGQDEYLSVQYRGDRLEYVSPRLKIMSTLVYFVPFFDESLGPRTDISILDAGARDGWTVSLFNQMGYANVTGVELIEHLVTHAQSQGRNVVAGNLENLHFEDSFFDVVFCRHTLEHVMNPAKAMSELIRVCRPGGLILVTLPIERKAHGKHTTAIPNLRLLKKLAMDTGRDNVSVIELTRSAKTKIIIPDADEALLLLRKARNSESAERQ